MKKKQSLPSIRERQKLYTQLQRLVNKVHGKDCDGQEHAVVEVHDRREGQWPFIQPVSRISYENPTPDDLRHVLNTALANVESTTRALAQVRLDMEFFFDRQGKESHIRTIATRVFGPDVIVGKAYEAVDNPPRYSQWIPYQVQAFDPDRDKDCDTRISYFDTSGLRPHSSWTAWAEFEQWLRKARRSLKRKYGKRIVQFYVRLDGVCGTRVSALVPMTEEQRLKQIAAKRARQVVLNLHKDKVQEIAKENLKKIKAEIASGESKSVHY